MVTSNSARSAPWSKAAQVGLALPILAIGVNALLNLLLEGSWSAVLFGFVQLVAIPVMCICGIVCSAVGIRQTRGGRRRGRGYAVAGLIVGPIVLLLWGIATYIYALFGAA